MFRRGSVVRSYVPIIYLMAICLIAFSIGESFGAILTIISVLTWTSVCLMLVYMFLFKDFMTKIRDSWNEEREVEDEAGEVAVGVAVTEVDKSVP